MIIEKASLKNWVRCSVMLKISNKYKQIHAFMQLHHTALTVNNLEESIAFYVEHFGFNLVKKYDRPDLKGKAALIKLVDYHLELWEFGDAQTNQDALNNLKIKGIRHIAFSVEDIDQTVEELKSRGIDISEIKLGASGKKYAFFEDPSGIALELYEA